MPASESPRSRTGRWPLPLLGALLIAAFAIPVILMRGKSATFDEVAHLPAGYSYLVTGRVQINIQHPPLIKELCALPLLFLGPRLPVDPETLEHSQPSLTYQWGFGKRFLYSQDADRLLFWGRIPAVLLSVGLAALMAAWAWRLWGAGGALLSLGLYVLDPTITAHAQLVTTDVGLGFFSVLFLYTLRRAVENPTRVRILLCGVCLGGALASKFSAVALIAIAGILLGLSEWWGPGGRTVEPAPASRVSPPGKGKHRQGGGGRAPAGKGDFARAAGILAAMIAMAFLVVWATYFFPLDPFFYLRGLQAVNRDHDPNYLPYLMGEMRAGGWRSYLLIAYLIKTPIPTLLILAASLVAYFRGRRASKLDEAFLIVPGAFFFVGYSLTADNLGVRYLIPCFPFFFLFAARLAPAARAAGIRLQAILALLMVWLLLEFTIIWPDHLSYFNEVTGIPPRGEEWLDDSNLDWGQGLIQLRNYLSEHPAADFRLCYFGSGDPGYYGIRGTAVSTAGLQERPAAGTYILSAHCVARTRADLARLYGDGPRNWPVHERPRAVVGHAFYIYQF